jgi:hypothetical protein
VARTPIPPQDVIATRELHVVDASETVRVEIGLPRYVGEAEAVCPYRFTWRDRVGGIDSHGADPVQALQLAMKMLPVELRHSEWLPVGRMYWLEPGDDMGFAERDGFQ